MGWIQFVLKIFFKLYQADNGNEINYMHKTEE